MPRPAIASLAGLIAGSGLTQREVAVKAQISPSYLSFILRGRFNPSPAVAQRLSAALGVTVEGLGVTVSQRRRLVGAAVRG
jgi:transcriptional regulator with XRE-family HTH domain